MLTLAIMLTLMLTSILALKLSLTLRLYQFTRPSHYTMNLMLKQVFHVLGCRGGNEMPAKLLFLWLWGD